MEPIEQAVNLIKKSQTISLALVEKAESDEVASLSAMHGVLTKLGKTTNIIFSGKFPEKFTVVFPEDGLLQKESAAADFIISINSASSPVKELRYQRTKDSLEIILTPKNKPITKEGVVFRHGQIISDVTVTLGVHRLEDLGKSFEEASDAFYEKPVVAIDPSAENESFGEVNLNDPAKSSVSEITAELLLELAPESVDQKIATFLLFGIIEKTNNFRSAHTKPSTLNIAAELIARGGKLDEIVRVLWKTKPLPLMQVWGRASIRSRLDEKNNLLLSILTKEDFLKTETSPMEALPFVLKHIEEHFALPENFAMMWQHPEEPLVRVLFKSRGNTKNLVAVEPWWGGSGYQSLKKQFASFREAEEALYSFLGA